jgi:hypothetical protein
MRAGLRRMRRMGRGRGFLVMASVLGVGFRMICHMARGFISVVMVI